MRAQLIMHVGDYNEIAGICRTLYNEYLRKNHWKPNGYYHEIYLNDPARTAPEKRRTVIRPAGQRLRLEPTDAMSCESDRFGRMKSIAISVVLTVVLTTVPAPAQQAAATLDAGTAGRFAALALACIQKEYPNKIAHVLNSPDDVKAPHELTPAFYGCYDWHSSVHGHWLLARLIREFPNAPSRRMPSLDSRRTSRRLASPVR